MRVLYSCLSQSWGGMEMYTVESVSKLLERNIPTELICFPNSNIEKSAQRRSIVTHPIKASGYINLVAILRVCSLIKKNNFDLIHTQASKDLWVLVPALKLARSKIPLVLTKQVGSFVVKKDFLHRIIYRRVDLAFAISRIIKTNLIDTTPLEESKIKILHNGIDTNIFDPLKANRSKIRREFDLSENTIVIGMLARFSWGKGHEDFLYAAKKLVSKFSHLKFLIVGEPSRGENEYFEKIRSLSSKYGLDNHVIFTGFRKDTPEVLAAMDIFAFPSHSEAFGIALAEALSAGKPSVCSKGDGILDIAVDNETSLLFEKRNADDLTEKLEQLISSPVKRIEFGTAARKRAIKYFDIEIITDKTIGYYKQLAGSD